MAKKTDDTLQSEAVHSKKQELLEKVSAFCDAHLDAGYKKLCTKIIEEMERMQPPPFMRGRLEIWAAGIVHALGSMNFLFDSSFEPYVSAGDIAAYFKVAPGSASQKASGVRDMFDLTPFSLDYMTDAMKEQMAPALELVAQTEQMMTGDMLGDMLEESFRLRNEVGDVIEDGEFIAAESRLAPRFYKLVERYQKQGPTPAIAGELLKLMEQDPDYYDPYLMLRDILLQQGQENDADSLLEIAFTRALSRILLPNGEWVPALEWGWQENRPIIRTLLNKALSEWEKGEMENALSLLRNLLRSNPGDNIGARWYILAIRLGMTFEAMEAEIGSEYGYDAIKTEEWFAKHHSKFPEDFDWWKEEVEYEV